MNEEPRRLLDDPAYWQCPCGGTIKPVGCATSVGLYCQKCQQEWREPTLNALYLERKAAEGVGSLLLEVQQDCIQATRTAADALADKGDEHPAR